MSGIASAAAGSPSARRWGSATLTIVRLRLESARAKVTLQALPLVFTLLFFAWFAYDRWLAVDSVLGLGLDTANYLATMHQISGVDVSGEGLLRPPLIGYFLWPLVHIFGPLPALKIGAVIVSTLHAGIFFALASRHVSRGVALAATLTFAFTFTTIGALNWGHLTLLAVAAYGLAFLCLREALAGGEKRYFIGLGLAAWLLVFSNQFGLIVLAISCIGAALAIISTPSLRSRIPLLMFVTGAVGLAAVPLASIYLDQSGAFGVETFLTFHWPWEGRPEFWRALGSQLPAGAVGRMAFAAVAVWGAVILARRSKADLAATVAPALALVVLDLFLSGGIADRAILFLSIWIWLFVAVAGQELIRRLIGFKSHITLASALGLSLLSYACYSWVKDGKAQLRTRLFSVVAAQELKTRLRHGQTIVTLGAVAGLLLLTFSSYSWFKDGRDHVERASRFNSYLSPDHLEVIGKIDETMASGPGVVYPRGRGWWVEGLTARQVFESDSGNVYVRDGRLNETRLANVLLTGESVITNQSIFASEAYLIPELPMDPAIGLDNGEFKHFAYLDDDLTWAILDGPERKRFVYLGNGTGSTPGERVYDLGGVRLRKTIAFVPREPALRMTFSVEGDKSSLSSLTIPIMAAQQPTMVFGDGDLAAFGFMVQGSFVNAWQAFITINIETPDGVEAIFEEDILNQRVVAKVTSDGQNGELLTLIFALVGPTVPPPGAEERFSAADSLQQLNPAFILVDTATTADWVGEPIGLPKQRWLAESPWFRLTAQSGSVVVRR